MKDYKQKRLPMVGGAYHNLWKCGLLESFFFLHYTSITSNYSVWKQRYDLYVEGKKKL